MKNKFLTIFFLLGQCIAQAADIDVRPPVNGGFSIRNADGSITRFKVEETGGVAIQNILSGLNNSPLCWNSTTKYLEICSESLGRDYTKPTISINVPSIATSLIMEIVATYTDNVGLGSYTNGSQNIQPFPEEVTSTTITHQIYTELGGGPKIYTFAVTDTSGNLARKTVSVSAPGIGGFQTGTYNINPNVSIPQGFFCITPQMDTSGYIAKSINITAGALGWSIASGFHPQLDVNLTNSFMTLMFLRSTSSVPLNTTGLSYDYNTGQVAFGNVNGTNQTYTSYYTISINPTSGQTNSVDVSIINKCTIPAGGTVSQGVPFNFTATKN